MKEVASEEHTKTTLLKATQLSSITFDANTFRVGFITRLCHEAVAAQYRCSIRLC